MDLSNKTEATIDGVTFDVVEVRISGKWVRRPLDRELEDGMILTIDSPFDGLQCQRSIWEIGEWRRIQKVVTRPMNWREWIEFFAEHPKAWATDGSAYFRPFFTYIQKGEMEKTIPSEYQILDHWGAEPRPATIEVKKGEG